VKAEKKRKYEVAGQIGNYMKRHWHFCKKTKMEVKWAIL